MHMVFRACVCESVSGCGGLDDERSCANEIKQIRICDNAVGKEKGV